VNGTGLKPVSYADGTALLPVVAKKRLLPDFSKFPLLALDEDGYDLSPDWYTFCSFSPFNTLMIKKVHAYLRLRRRSPSI
jgi:hypothetical protein